jgi:hypothetical protein
MAKSSHWTRLCVDIDRTGKPIGTSWEKHIDQTTVEFGTGPQPEPFDEAVEAWMALFEWYVGRHGLQRHLL